MWTFTVANAEGSKRYLRAVVFLLPAEQGDMEFANVSDILSGISAGPTRPQATPGPVALPNCMSVCNDHLKAGLRSARTVKVEESVKILPSSKMKLFIAFQNPMSST